MFAPYYQTIYLIIVIILTFTVMSSYGRIGVNSIRKSDNSKVLFLALFLIIAIGLRPVSGLYFVDMANYNSYYNVIYGQPFVLSLEVDNFIFDNVFSWFASQMIPVEYFFLFIAAIYFGCVAWACVKIFLNDSLLAFIVYLGAFSTFSYGTNGIKAGAAASIFLLALAYRNNKPLAVFFLWASLGFHHSMLAPIVAYVVAYFYRQPKAYLWAWIICLLLAAAHVTLFMSLFVGYSSEHEAEYLTTNSYDKSVSGFRPDFILYSAVPIFLGYQFMRKRYVVSDYFNFIWCVYTATNCVFLLCTYGDFINRIAYLSWLMYPIVLLYPFVNTEWPNHPNTSKRYLKYAVYGHLGFTAFMTFIYYA